VSKKLVVRPQAVVDLDDQALFIAIDNMEAGLRLYAAAHDAYARLLEMPELGTRCEVGTVELEGLRMWPIPGFPNHLIFYRPNAAGVEIVRVLHAARDIPRILEGT
jgi:toxin ParE1/3/4